MSNKLMSGFWRIMLQIPPSLWKKQIQRMRKKIQAEIGFMTDEHRRVHHFIVRELPREGHPISMERISNGLEMNPARVEQIVAELEDHMTFLVRNREGNVHWAYPVTVEPTPHHLTFSTGEQLYAA